MDVVREVVVSAVVRVLTPRATLRIMEEGTSCEELGYADK